MMGEYGVKDSVTGLSGIGDGSFMGLCGTGDGSFTDCVIGGSTDARGFGSTGSTNEARLPKSGMSLL